LTPSTRARLAFALGLCAATFVAGCGFFGPRDKPSARTRCPQGMILADASEATFFQPGQGRDLTDVVGQARIAELQIDCKPERRRVVVDLQVAIAAERGPANRSAQQEVEYFVAIVAPNGDIIKRDEFRVPFKFPENRTRVGAVEELEPIIPVSDPARAPEYQIWVGLQLTEDQLAWNRRKKPAR
jgi:hypothetical protein